MNIPNDPNNPINQNNQNNPIWDNFFNLEDEIPNNIDPNSTMSKLSGDEIYEISSNFFPSAFFTSILIVGLVFTKSYCDSGFAIALKIMLGIHILFIAKAISHLIMIFLKKQNTSINKIVLSSANLSLTIVYYAGCIFSIVIYANQAEGCFENNTLLTAIMFAIVTVGFIGLMRYVLYSLIFLIVFPVLVDYYFNNAGLFHYQFGFNPEMLNKIPTTNATEIHLSDCTICTDRIDIGNEIMILRCAGRHFYHSHCIKEWLVVKFCCPLCKSYNIL